jgi:malonyl-CoA O-methyltransferase
MKSGLFVTGTDTNVGKTVLSAAVMHRYRSVMPVRYWKPVQTGHPEDDDSATVRRLVAGEVHDCGVRLPRPLSPHLSARLAGVNIDVAGVLAMASPGAGWIVEGAGGVLVPLNEHELMIDLIAALGVAALVATRSTLGTINHTLLTIAALRARSIPVAGVVMIGDPNRDNREAIETYGGVPVLGEMPRFADLTAETLAEWSRTQLDRDSCLEAFLK